MAVATVLLTIEQFHDLYGSESGYEYWFGEVFESRFRHGCTAYCKFNW
jgi:hypothetical protein